MNTFIKDNWFKITIIIIASAYVFILFFNFYLEGKEYNLSVYKDSVKYCFDLADGQKSILQICQKALLRYSLNPNFFVNDRLQKEYQREKAFWSCYGVEWDKSHNSETSSKYCSSEADKILK